MRANSAILLTVAAAALAPNVLAEDKKEEKKTPSIIATNDNLKTYIAPYAKANYATLFSAISDADVKSYAEALAANDQKTTAATAYKVSEAETALGKDAAGSESGAYASLVAAKGDTGAKLTTARKDAEAAFDKVHASIVAANKEVGADKAVKAAITPSTPGAGTTKTGIAALNEAELKDLLTGLKKDLKALTDQLKLADLTGFKKEAKAGAEACKLKTGKDLDTCAAEQAKSAKSSVTGTLPDISAMVAAYNADKTDAQKIKTEQITWAYKTRPDAASISKDFFNTNTTIEVSNVAGDKKTTVSLADLSSKILEELVDSLQIDEKSGADFNANKTSDNPDQKWCSVAREHYFFNGDMDLKTASAFFPDDSSKDATPQKCANKIMRKCFHYVGDARTLVASAVATTLATAAVVASFL